MGDLTDRLQGRRKTRAELEAVSKADVDAARAAIESYRAKASSAERDSRFGGWDNGTELEELAVVLEGGGLTLCDAFRAYEAHYPGNDWIERKEATRRSLED